MAMMTYLTITFNSEGAGPAEVTKVVEDMGFSPARGVHDYSYDWGKRRPNMDEILEMLQKLHNRLKGLNVQYQATTL